MVEGAPAGLAPWAYGLFTAALWGADGWPGCLSLPAMQGGCILPRQYEQVARLGTDCTNLLGAWIASDRKRFSPKGAQVPAGS